MSRSRPAATIPRSVTMRTLLAPARCNSPGISFAAPRPWTMRVGKLITLAMPCSCPGGSGSDDLEVPLQLPLGDRRLELAALPVAGAQVVVDELRAQDLAHLPALCQRLGSRAQGGRQRLGAGLVAVARGLGGQRDLVLDAPEPRAPPGSQRPGRGHVPGGEAGLHPGRRGRA